MEDVIFKAAIAAIVSEDYCESDIKTLKEYLNVLTKKEHSLKKEIEKETNDFVKNKDKHQNELKNIRGDIKQVKSILKSI